MTGKKRSVYFPADLAEWIEEQAVEDQRTFNGYLVKLLREERRRCELVESSPYI